MVVIDKTPLYIVYGCDPEEFKYIELTENNFSVRLFNRLMGAGMKTVEDLLLSNYTFLSEIKGFGKNCFDEVDNFLSAYKKDIEVSKKILSDDTKREIRAYRDMLKSEDYSFVSDELSDEFLDWIEKYKIYRQFYDVESFDNIINNVNMTCATINMCNSFIKQNKNIIAALKNIPQSRKINDAKYYIRAFTYDDSLLFELNKLYSEGDSLEKYIRKALNADNKNHVIFNKFSSWCTFNIEQEITDFFDTLYVRDNTKIVVESRAKGFTLQQTGDLLEVTRERIRQIEAKAVKRLSVWNRSHRLLMKISADRNGDDVLTSVELLDYFGDYYQELLHLFRNAELIGVTYDKQTDAFVIGDEDLPSRVQDYIESLPEKFDDEKYEKILVEAVEQYELPEELLVNTLIDYYQHTGTVWHRSKLTLSSIYEDILKKYYSEGIHIFDDEELQQFRNKVYEEYGDVKLSTSSRALATRITDVAILCGRGRYKPRQDEYISEELYNKIISFIEENEMPLIMTNTIFTVFLEELTEQGVDNKYYLHGILRELVGDKYYFRRDYISKDETATSMYLQIVNYIKKFNYPVNKEQIRNAFPGITEIVISFAVSDADILNLHGEYIHVDNLALSDNDIVYLKRCTENALEKYSVCHTKIIYEFIKRDYPEILQNNCIKFAYSLFGLLEYLFGEDFNFSRPFISKADTEILKPAFRLDEYVNERQRITVRDFLDYAREIHFFVYSILDAVCAYSDTHILINKEEFATHEYIGVNEEIAHAVEDIIYNELNDKVIYISELRCIRELPKINVSWNEWLIFGVLYNWSEKLQVGTTSNKYRDAEPLVARQGVNFDEYIDILNENGKNTSAVDNLDDIDSLIEDLIDIDWDE